jgi:Zn-dependent protease
MTDEQPEERRMRNRALIAASLQKGPSGKTPSDPEQKQDRESGKSRFRRWGPAGAGVLFLLGKLKFLLPLFKFLKFGSMLSMLVMVWVYATIWGLPFAVGFVLLIFVHEMGHALVLRWLGIDAGAPVFIPFVGAVIAMRGVPRNAYVESLVGIGGPALGSLAAAFCLLVGWMTDKPFWYALASTGFLINLFNMIPISPMDGGRIVGVISRWFWAVGYAVGIAVFLKTHSPILFLILLLGLFSLGKTLKGPREGYYDVPNRLRVQMGVAYFGLVVLLTLGMKAAQGPLAHITDSSF